MKPTDQDILTAEKLRLKTHPNEPFPLRIDAVARFLRHDRDLVVGTIERDKINQGAG